MPHQDGFILSKIPDIEARQLTAGLHMKGNVGSQATYQ